MGNTYSSEMMEKYNNAGGSPSKEEFDNYEKEKSKNVRPEEEKSKSVKPEKTFGEKFMNMFRGDKKEKNNLLSSVPSSKYSPNTNISSDDSIKFASKGLITPPPTPQSETVVLPEQSDGGGGGGSIPQGSPPFSSSTPSHSELGPTNSPVPFIDVISNQYLSVV